ncbi:Protein XRP2 [Chionoecetes opilio]|uniref:Protein XRP2 n=1 Tax=Chionoecetes opilio TaxID=41210 RepID=A0A8J4YRW3_CHIOP|nr:Protein XRP2 [Chionoecetes opilio]
MAVSDVNIIHPPLLLSIVKRLISQVCRFTWDTSLGDALRAPTMGHYRSDSSPHPWKRQTSRISDVTLTRIRPAASAAVVSARTSQVSVRSPSNPGPRQGGGLSRCRDKKDRVDPADFTVEGLRGQEVGRVPGTINGQQFIIQNCQSSHIFLLDHINTITIDDCSDCTIFIGPTTGSSSP